ncbi:MAG: hypothetical protein KDJ35_08915 [Alphaproteobacteria bacterium]|nr:hypothetical protein [Alphaproteobacteria bacterium]
MGKDDQNFDALMRQREVPAMRSDLPQRIIDAARLQARDVGSKNSIFTRAKQELTRWLASVSQGVMVPHPALVMGVVLVLGVMVGVFMHDVSDVPEEDMIFLYVENSFLFEDWL